MVGSQKGRPRSVLGRFCDNPFLHRAFTTAEEISRLQALLDARLKELDLPETDRKVLKYIGLATLGDHRLQASISIREFARGRFDRWKEVDGCVTRHHERRLDHGCGVKNFGSISRALGRLVAAGLVGHVPSRGGTNKARWTPWPVEELEQLVESVNAS